MKAGALLLALAWPVLGLALAIRVLSTEAYLRFAYAQADLADTRGFGAEARLALALPSTRFIVGGTAEAELRALRFEGSPLYRTEEVDHLLDVRRVIGRIERLAGLLLLAALFVLPLQGRSRRRRFGQGLEAGGWLGLVVLGSLGLGVLLAWERVFTGMHRVLFPHGNWQFPIDSGLIRLFPDAFWYRSAVVLIGFLCAHCLMGILLGRGLGRRAADA